MEADAPASHRIHPPISIFFSLTLGRFNPPTGCSTYLPTIVAPQPAKPRKYSSYISNSTTPPELNSAQPARTFSLPPLSS